MVRQNLGKRDRVLWAVVGIILMVLAFYKIEYWVWRFLLVIPGLMFLTGGVTGFSFLYSFIGYSSKGYGIDRITKRDIEKAVKEYGLKTEPIVKVKPTKVVKKKAVKKTAPKKVVKKAAPKKAVKKVAKKATKKVVKKK